jgi:hypothetical protein
MATGRRAYALCKFGSIAISAVGLLVCFRPKRAASATKPSASATKPSAAAPKPAASRTLWIREPTATIKLDPTRQYVALLQLTGLESLLGSASDIYTQLHKVVPWKTLDVYDDPEKLPASLPVPREDDTGRYWAIGVPSSPLASKGDAHIAQLWSRPVS